MGAPVDEPSQCVDPPSLEDEAEQVRKSELKKAAVKLYAKLQHCGNTLPTDEVARFSFAAVFEPGQRQAKIGLVATTTTHCEVGECLRQAIEQQLVSKQVASTTWEPELQPELARGNAPVEVPRDEESGAHEDDWRKLTASECTKHRLPIGGRLTAELIQTEVRKSYDVFRGCYDAALGRRRTAKGSV